MSLRKGATFHQPTTPERELPHHFKTPSPPQRSQSTLEDVVGAHQRRVALTLGAIDRGLSAVEDKSPTARQSFPDEADPIPQGFLDHTLGSPATKSYGSIMDGPMSSEPASVRRSLRPRHNRRPSRYSDSALGSSIRSSSGKSATETQATSISEEQCTKATVVASAITRTASHLSTVQSLPRLRPRATNRIHEHVLKPLLAKQSLKDFHPIIKDCPRRINGKEIVCLRDLEKTLIFMAPVSDFVHDEVVDGVAHWFSRLKERTKSAALYLDFCLTSIRCIQATVEYLSDREQTRPHDRPYTNGYFVDLVDQIKQYAQQVQAAKEKEEKGESLDDMDHEAYVPIHSFLRQYGLVLASRDLASIPEFSPAPTSGADSSVSSGDEVRLHGGFTKNGRPAELIRVKKNGKAISLATGLPVELEEDSKDSMRFKRSLSVEAEEDESILRSMARRKRSASASELAPKRCREPGCDKEFKRPCDLTKHEKTHSRPWKCSVETCKYHEYGWPTEKEMARHVNDKHSAAPALFQCEFPPCPYRSKRQSNCKQHMEKAHGWTYVRSKNNGKNRDKAAPVTATNNGLPTPQTTNIRTPSSNADSIATPAEDEFDGYQLPEDNSYTNTLDFPEYNCSPDNLSFPSGINLEYSPDMDHNSGSMSETSPYMGHANFFDDEMPTFQGSNVDFPLFDNEDIYSANVHLPTPSPHVYNDQIFETSGMPFMQQDPMPHISPHGQGNAMLYTPASMRDVDEGFEDFAPGYCQSGNDFQLFPNSTGGTIASSATSGLFGEIPTANINYPGVSAKALLDFYAEQVASVIPQHNNTGMEWISDDQYYGSH